MRCVTPEGGVSSLWNAKALRVERSQRELREAALFDAKERLAEGSAAKQAADEIVKGELSRAESDSLMLVAENENLRAQVLNMREQLQSVPDIKQVSQPNRSSWCVMWVPLSGRQGRPE